MSPRQVERLARGLVEPQEPGVAEGAAAAGCSPERFAAALGVMQATRAVLHAPGLTRGRYRALLERSAELRRNRDVDLAHLDALQPQGAVALMARAMRSSPAWDAVYRAETALLLAEAAWAELTRLLAPEEAAE